MASRIPGPGRPRRRVGAEMGDDQETSGNESGSDNDNHEAENDNDQDDNEEDADEESHDTAPTVPTGSSHSRLDSLVEMLIASKRSLTTMDMVWRAREIVDGARAAVEQNAVLAARIAFVGSAGVEAQMRCLDGVRAGIGVVEGEEQGELKNITEALDKASGMLDSTLESLRAVNVDAAFRPVDEDQKCLLDFVDESGVQDLYESIRKSIDRCDAARQTLVATYTLFDQDLKFIKQSLQPDGEDGGQEEYTTDDGVSPVPELFYSLEQNATTCAEHLQGLVKHYDLCVTALKHTEGGGDIINKYSQDTAQDQTKLAGFGLGITNAQDETLEQISPADQAEMLKVLVRDAAEVEDVVAEINDRLIEMEERFTLVQAYVDHLGAKSQRQSRAMALIRQAAANVPSYINACADFQAQWEEEQEDLIGKIEEIEQLQEFYTGFAAGYDNLVLEVQRRRQAAREMEKVARHAMSQIDKMHKVEVAARDEFRSELGEYLPNDIWPGLVDPPVRYEIGLVDGESAPLPELRKDVVQRAMQRLEARAAAN